MTKASIVKRLLESNYITKHEADVLLKVSNHAIDFEDKYVSKTEFSCSRLGQRAD